MRTREGNAADFFNILPDTAVMIYGAGGLGRQCGEKLRHYCRVEGFLDLAAEKNSERDNLPVLYPFGHAPDELSRDTVIVICLHSSIEQVRVAGKLYREGFDKILFVPDDIGLFQYNAARQMESAYAHLYDGSYHLLQGIPRYGLLIHKAFIPFTIRSSKQFVTTLVSVDLLTVGDQRKELKNIRKLASADCSPEFKQGFELVDTYSCKPYPMFSPLLDIYRAMIDGAEPPEKYVAAIKQLQYCGNLTNREFFQERLEIFRMLEKKNRFGLTAFYNCPIEVGWNIDGSLSVFDGNNRGAFLYCKGYRWMPCRMTSEDFAVWANESCAKELRDWIDANGLSRISAPILNPYFTTGQPEGSDAILDSMCRVMEWMGKDADISRIHFLDWSLDNGYAGRCFARMGAACSATVAEDAADKQLVEILNRLHYSQNKILSPEDIDAGNGFELAFLSDRGDLSAVETVKQLRGMGLRMAICMFVSDSHFVDEVRKTTDFQFYQKLSSYYYYGERYETGVLCAERDMDLFRQSGGVSRKDE